MTLRYAQSRPAPAGGIHESRKDAEGRPTAETIAAFPDVARRIEAARESIAGVWTFLDMPEHPWFR